MTRNLKYIGIPDIPISLEKSKVDHLEAMSRFKLWVNVGIKNCSLKRARTRIPYIKKTYLIQLKSESVDCLYCYAHQYPREQRLGNGPFRMVSQL